MSSVWGMILQWGSTVKVGIELPVAARHRREMSEKSLKSWFPRSDAVWNLFILTPGFIVGRPETFRIWCSFCWTETKLFAMGATAQQNQQNDLCAQLRRRCPGWSESSLCTQWVAKDPRFLHADGEDWSDWADAQADLSLRWTHRSFCWFCHAAAQIFLYCVVVLSFV